MATYAIGDIHGCYQEFCRLLRHIDYSANRDTLWFVGDAVNRGPDSLAMLRWLHQHQDSIAIVLGNHDLHLLAAAEGATRPRRRDTFGDILAAPDRDILCGWLRRQPLAHQAQGWLMVHAGVLPMWDAAQTIALAGEAQRLIAGEQWRTFARDMYGNTPAAWDESLTGAARARAIVNALTRMRICTPAGAMQLEFSGAPDSIPAGHVAWFDAPSRQSADTSIVCGHWSALGARQQGNVHAIDSGCLWGGALTALRLEDRQLFQVAAARRYSQ